MRRRRGRSRRREAGFGLLEGLVALVLFSGTGLVLFGWINANLDAAARLQQRERVQHAQRLAAAWVHTFDPMQRASGEEPLAPGLLVRWRVQPIAPMTAGAPFPGGTTSPFRLTLFEVEVTAADETRGTVLAQFAMTRVGVERDPFLLPPP